MPPDKLVRFVLGPDGEVAPDFSGKLPGRGAWVSAKRDALEEAIGKKAFSRAFKQTAPLQDDLGARVEAGLAKAALSALGIARRTGDVVLGFEKVLAALKDGKASVLVLAQDGAEGGKAKLRAHAKGAAVVTLFSEQELSSALGRSPVVNVAVKKGVHATRFLTATRRLEGFRAVEEEQ